MAEPNFVDKTIWTGDNLDILRGMNSETVDLIYLDPPFNSNKNYEAPVGSKAAGAAFKDTWSLSDLDVAWMGLIADEHPAIAYMLDTAGKAHGKGMQSYLTMMAARLLEMRRVLKDTGSIYLHCDPYASHYLKMLMDAVYGARHFKNEVVWSYRRYTAKSNRFQREHDVILYYGKGSPTFNVVYEPYGEGSGKRDSHYKQDEEGRWFRWQKRRGQEPYKVYLSEGRRTGDVWQISHINASAKERVGYPTQKPLALLERIIKASSNEGDVVLDPFAGCATACVAAEKLGRQWVGIDLSPMAYRLVQERLAREVQVGSEESPRLTGWKVTHRTDIPRRTDIDVPIHYRQNKHVLYGQQEGYCAGCNMFMEFRHFEVDHVIPESKGGTGHIDNLQLLCGFCNRTKGNRPQEYLIARLKELEYATT